MFETRNGLMRLNLQQFAETAGDTSATAGDTAGSAATSTSTDPAGETKAEGNVGETAGTQGGTSEVETMKAEIARLNAEMAKMKKAKDDATHEASVANKALKAKMTAEEIAAKEKEEAEEAQKQRIIELEKQVAKAGTVKAVMGKLAMDEETAGEMADSLYGAANIENALLLFQKTWAAREKALKMEYGRVPPPGTGGSSEDKETQAAMALAKELGEQKAHSATSVRDQLKGLIR